jgi:hypothetical protein
MPDLDRAEPGQQRIPHCLACRTEGVGRDLARGPRPEATKHCGQTARQSLNQPHSHAHAGGSEKRCTLSRPKWRSDRDAPVSAALVLLTEKTSLDALTAEAWRSVAFVPKRVVSTPSWSAPAFEDT